MKLLVVMGVSFLIGAPSSWFQWTSKPGFDSGSDFGDGCDAWLFADILQRDYER